MYTNLLEGLKDMTTKIITLLTGCLVLASISFGAGYARGAANSSPDPSSHFTLEYHPAEPRISSQMWVLTWKDEFELWMSDRTKDGSADTWTYWVSGKQLWKVRDRNGDHKLDLWFEMTSDTEGLQAEDNDYDGVVDEVHDIVVVTKY